MNQQRRPQQRQQQPQQRKKERTNPVGDITAIVAQAAPMFEARTVDRSIAFEREAGFAVQALMANDYLLGIAMQERQSLLDAISNVAAIGISLNPAKRHAYLIPRKGKITLEVSYMGLMALAQQAGSIAWAQAELVMEHDNFMLRDVGLPPAHERHPFKDRGAVVGVYVVAKTVDGDHLVETMTSDEINAIRDRSESWKSYSAGDIRSSPWATDWGEMAKKTVVKRAYKYWPTNPRLEQAVYHMNTEGGEGIDFAAEQAQAETKQRMSTDEISELEDKIDAASTVAELRKVWAANIKGLKDKGSINQYEHIKAKFMTRAQALEGEQS